MFDSYTINKDVAENEVLLIKNKIILFTEGDINIEVQINPE